MRIEIADYNPRFHEMDDIDYSETEIVKYVKEALASVRLGDRENYDHLVGVLHHKERRAPDEVALLVTSLKALSGAVSHIDMICHSSLLSSIFGMSMWNYGPDMLDALLELVISLAASNAKLLDSCLDMLVSNFMPPYYLLDALKEPRGLAKKEQVLSRVHTALKDIAALVPLVPMRLPPIVAQRMPSVYKKDHLILIYIENMLKLESDSMGELVGSTMLMAVVDRLIDLDVEIGLEEILQDDSYKGIFELELEEGDEAIDYDGEDDGELPRALTHKFLSGNVIAEILDSLMVLTFEHLESCENSGRLAKVFEILLKSFQKTVMTTYKSKFAQFVMFYACALDPENCGIRFAMTLADIFILDAYPPVTRMSAVAYLASYLSRGKFVSASTVVTILKRLVDWCLDYCTSQDGAINPKAHRVFYSGCQAIMYVLCFRMRSMMDVPRLKSQLLVMPIELVLKHRLNPLEVCLPSVVAEFLRQAKAAHLFTVSQTFIFNDLLESENSRDFGGRERLDMFFPFDPCLLKRCDSFIRPNFVYWSMVKTTYDDDEVNSSDEEDDHEDSADLNELNIMDEGMGRSYEEQEVDLDYALDKMSITPRNGLGGRFGGRFHGQMQMPSRIRPSTSPESL
ncbi:RNA polymerase I-specific transcription initiation factor rrn3 [Tripterygium wilfordii]|uniref:RNA polymerase I-specific transcription initiation factor rrn3 n=1 Tax=Tripterygium wilfordii TaxID=458696 RepID=A0A7J7DH01_TRIWF|nr:RNA polymerase I-specific transcription initiation factor RRN3 [Tripterygium wilfordii]KAF5745539.1 RNA polymerase I-specific transcription initiation factor rrn3 [Tripterygium wilfordii]